MKSPKRLLLGMSLLVAINASHSCINAASQPLIKYEKGKYQGLTPHAIKLIKDTRDQLRARERSLKRTLLGFEAINHAAVVSRLNKGNMFIYGPPKAAKSLFVRWFFGNEATAPFELQLNQMMTEQAFIGGQNFDTAKAGKFEINTEGSLADYTVALIDEVDKGNPSALSALLSLLNERKILAGNKVVTAKLETLFATSNANLPEIFDQFVQNGQGSTAPALLNRFQIKAFVYNWLPIETQVVLNQIMQMHAREEFCATVPPVEQDTCVCERATDSKACVKDRTQQKKDEKQIVNWAEVRELASVLIEPNEAFWVHLNEFTNKVRQTTNTEIKDSEEQASKSYGRSTIYYPTADLTERLRQQIADVVKMSVFVDLLMSDYVNDDNLESLQSALKDSKSHCIEFGPLSLWRSYLVMTLVGLGQPQLVLPTSKDDELDVLWGMNFDASKARDTREAQMIDMVDGERKRFVHAFREVVKSLQSNTSTNLKYKTGIFGVKSDDIERVLIALKKK